MPNTKKKEKKDVSSKPLTMKKEKNEKNEKNEVSPNPLTKEDIKMVNPWSLQEILVMGFFVVAVFTTWMLGIFLSQESVVVVE